MAHNPAFLRVATAETFLLAYPVSPSFDQNLNTYIMASKPDSNYLKANVIPSTTPYFIEPSATSISLGPIE